MTRIWQMTELQGLGGQLASSLLFSVSGIITKHQSTGHQTLRAAGGANGAKTGTRVSCLAVLCVPP